MKTLTCILLSCLSWAIHAGPLKVGTTMWSGYEPLYLAQHNGFYNRNIRIINYPSTSEVMRSFRNKALEVAALTLDEVIQLREKNLPVTVFLICDISNGADALLARPPINRLTDLKGKRVAVESTAVGAYVLTRALDIGQLQLQDIRPVNKENNEQLEAYLKQEVDAVVTYEPVRSQLLANGAREIFNSREIPGEIVDVLVVHTELLEQRRDELQQLTDGWFRALEHMKKHPENSQRYIAERQKISPQDVGRSLRGLEFPDRKKTLKLMTGSPALLEISLQRLVETMKGNQLLHQDVSVTNLLSVEFVEP